MQVIIGQYFVRIKHTHNYEYLKFEIKTNDKASPKIEFLNNTNYNN